MHKLMRERGIGFKQAVNAALRDALAGRRSARPRVWTKSVPLGAPCFPVEHALRVAAQLEDEEILRKMQLGK